MGTLYAMSEVNCVNLLELPKKVGFEFKLRRLQQRV